MSNAHNGHNGQTERHDGRAGRLGLALALALALALLVLGGGPARAQAAQPPSPIISAGSWHTCALRPTGAVDCWGLNDFGQAHDQVGPYGAYVPPPPTITHSAAVQVISVPPSVVEGQLESDQFLRAFIERQHYTLPQAITVNGTVIPAGTRVHVFAIHADKVGADNSRALQLSGWVAFDTPVLAVISDGATLLTTHATLGSAATTYSTRTDQGIDVGDSVTQSGQNRVNVWFKLWDGSDNVRVVTLAP